MPTRFRRSLVAVVAIVSLLAATFGTWRSTTLASSPSKPVAHHTHALTNVYFILNWLPNVEFAGLWVADHFHWWQQAGINLTYKPWSQSVTPEIDVPQKGGDTFGFQAGAAIAIARSKNVPIEAVYTDTQRSVFGLTVLAKSKIHKLSDLKGKKVGYQPHELYAPETMLSCVGLKPQQDYRSVPVSFDISQLTSGNVDAYLTFLTNEPIALRLQGVATRSFRAADYCYHFYDDVMFTTTNLINSNPALVAKVTKIVARGFAWAHSHPQQAARITTGKYFTSSAASSSSSKVTASQNLQQQTLELKAFSQFSRDSRGRFSGLMTRKYWQDSINILYKYHQITTKPNVATLFTNRFNLYKP